MATHIFQTNETLLNCGASSYHMRSYKTFIIDRQIGSTQDEFEPIEEPKRVDTAQPEIELYKPKVRKSGTGCVTIINDHLYEGRYAPTNAYGKVNVKRIIYTPKQRGVRRKIGKTDSTGQGRHKSRKRMTENDERIVHH